MITSPFISLHGATENRRAPAKDVKPPHLVRVEGLYIDTSDKLLTTPIPSFSFPAAPTIPSTPARTRVEQEVINIAAEGTGYTAGSDDVLISGGGGTNADLSLVVNGSGGIVAALVSNSGSGYTSAPSVVLSGGASGSITVVNWVISDYTAWFQIGAYTCILGTSGYTRRLRWCAPGRPTVWDKYEIDGDIEVLTGANYADLPGTGAMESGVTIGSIAVLFDAEGIGVLTLTGDFEAPFSYAKTLNETTAESDTRLLNQMAEFCGYDGRIWRTNGYSITAFDGPMDLNKVYNVTWPPASTAASFAFNTATQHYVIHPAHSTGNGVTIWVDRESGAYAANDGDDATCHFITGALSLLPEEKRTHIQRVRLYTQVSGTFTGNCTVTAGMKGIHDTTYHTSGSTNIGTASTAGDYETEIEVNATYKQPQLKFTFTLASGATIKVQGMVLVYGEGGLR